LHAFGIANVWRKDRRERANGRRGDAIVEPPLVWNCIHRPAESAAPLGQ
jgi:hypothetical protein